MRIFTALLRTCVLLVATTAAYGQQTIGDASVTGRISDPSGAAVAGAVITARHRETDVTTTMTADGAGRFRFPYLRIGPYELRIAHDGFAPVTRSLELHAGSAFDVPVTLALADVSTDVTVTADVPVLDSARSQVAVSIDAAVVQALPLNGRNLLDVALLAPIGRAAQHQQHAAVRRDVRGAGRRPVGGQPAQLLQQRRRRRPLGQRRCGRPERHDVRRRCHPGDPGGHVRRAGRTRTRAGRPCQRRHAERHQPPAGHRVRVLCATTASTPPTRSPGTTLPMSQLQYGGERGRAVRTQPHVLLRQRGATRSRAVGLTTIAPATADIINARLKAVGYPGAAGHHRPVRRAGRDAARCSARIDHAVSGAISWARATASTTSRPRTRAAPAGLPRRRHRRGLDNRDQAIALSQPAHAGRAHGERDARAVHAQRPASPALRPGGAGGQHRRHRDVRHPLVESAGARESDRRSSCRQRRRTSAARMPCAPASTSCTTRTASCSRGRVQGSYVFASLPAFLAGTYNNGGFTQTFGATDVEQGSTNLGLYAQDAWSIIVVADVQPRGAVRPAVARDGEDRRRQRRRRASASPGHRARTVARDPGQRGLFFDRVPLRSLANALLSAGNTTDLSPSSGS